MSETYLNAFPNALTPFSQGAAQIILLRSLIDETIKYCFGDKMALLDTFEIQTYAVSMEGALCFGEQSGALRLSRSTDLKQDMMDGLKSIPSVLAAYLVHSLRKNGVEIPNFTTKQVLILVASQMLSRPLLQALFASLPKDPQAAFLALDALLSRQRTLANKKNTA
jgi:hypothetical protein